MTTIYRCTQCPRRGYAFAFYWFQPGINVGPEAFVWCPKCKGRNTVVDSDGQPADPVNPLTMPQISLRCCDAHRAVDRGLRGYGASGGRLQHGGVLKEQSS